MVHNSECYIKRAENLLQDEVAAVKDLAQKLDMDKMEALLFFCSPAYDLSRLESAFNSTFSCPVIGCTTAGEIGSAYQTNGIVAAAFSSEVFRFHLADFQSLSTFNVNEAKKEIRNLADRLQFSHGLDSSKMFAFMLIDGLSLKEEQVVSCLHNALEGVQLIGGSAGDNLQFSGTHVFIDGSFRLDAVAFALIETKLDFEVFKFQHVNTTDKEMVITKADPFKRIVYEINGVPAATELARIIGIKKEELTLQIYSTHPLMLQIGDEWYIRSIQKYSEDDSLTFACAIDAGLPVTVGEVSGLVETLDSQVRSLNEDFASIELTIGCDCIHRRLEIQEIGVQKEVEKILSTIKFIGFSTYGEQYQSIHVNQTMTGVCIGKRML